MHPEIVRRDPVGSGAQRNFALDVLRGVAIALVLVHHMAISERAAGEGAGSVFQQIALTGWIGVDLFFVLSGYLIARLLFAEIEATGTLDVKRFWLRRGLKIWPSYFAAYGLLLVAVALYDVGTHHAEKAASRLYHAIPSILLVQNYFPPEFRWPNSWSLAIEEHFYHALPLVLLALLRRSRPFHGFFAGGAMLCAFILALRTLDAGNPVPNGYFPTHLRADSLCFGVMIGYLGQYRRPLFDRLARHWPLAFLLVAAAIAAIAAMGSPAVQVSQDYVASYTVGFTFLYVGFGALVLVAGAYPAAGLRAHAAIRAPLRALAWMGTYSYAIYLAQAVIPRMPGFYTLDHKLARAVLDGVWTSRLVFLAVALLAGIALARSVEQPVLRLRDRWLPSRAKKDGLAGPSGPDSADALPPLSQTRDAAAEADSVRATELR